MREIALITGTRKGLGRFLVDHFVQKGFAVAGCSREPFEGDWPEGYRHYCVDIADEAAVVGMVRDVQERYGGLTILVNNAGIAAMNHLLLTPLATVQRVFATNVFGTFLMLREAAKVMQEGRYGRIVNFATVATPLDLEGEAAYAASKAAVESLTRVAARELAPCNITVNAVGPTPVMTDLIRNVPRKKMDALIARQAIRRLGEPRDVAQVIDFFISRDSDFVTGQTVFLGGVS
ncbi:MAG: SDR family oxidoreductase [Sinobacteraceae bacterium]|nr:SDR family oxidoreductase [Nevskiaceae bacterium]MCP5467142.1 SDR family oxidoreductase [Nevskiaceae bacterium]MCP5472029.1 SDR family oxidoreductase [Nevskiaceae bacterium]